MEAAAAKRWGRSAVEALRQDSARATGRRCDAAAWEWQYWQPTTVGHVDVLRCTITAIKDK